MIHRFSEDFVFEEPSEFTDPFRYIPHCAVKEAAREVMERIESDLDLASDFSEGKMLGVLVCREGYLAAFSGNVGGRSIIDGFVPPIYDLTDPSGKFKRREAEISALNNRIDELLSSEDLTSLRFRLAESEQERDKQLGLMRDAMNEAKRKRSEVRAGSTDAEILARLVRESQFEKAELKRIKTSWEMKVTGIKVRIDSFNEQISELKNRRARMSDELQDWIFRQYIVHNALGESASIADIFASEGLVPPGGTGECAAPKLLEYAYRNDLEPLAMGEFWYGKSPDTAVRTHGHFYPSCTSKCGPLLGYMLRGMSVAELSVIPKTHAFPTVRHPLAGSISSPSSDRSAASQNWKSNPVIIYEDEAVAVVEKPSGMPSVPGLDGRISLIEWLTTVMSDRPKHLHAVHRLDMDTSGVMIFAKTHEAAVNLRRQFEEHTIRKTYMARVAAIGREAAGQPLRDGTIILPLSPDYDERPRQKVDFKQGKAAHTEYEIVKTNPNGTADLLLYPHTGRTHQLRVHCAHTLGLGRPILGDLLYGSHSVNCLTRSSTKQERQQQGAFAKPLISERLCLHALSITFTHPLTDKAHTFTSKQLCY